LLLRWHQRPIRPVSADMANLSLRFIKYTTPCTLAFMSWIYLSPSAEDKSVILSNFLMSLLIGGLFSFACPLSLWMRLWLSMPCNRTITTAEHEEDYYHAQHMWSKEMKYHKDQFIYKNLPEAKNPEMLSPGVTVAAKPEDMKDSYGVSAAKMADAATDGTETATRMKGGRVLDGDAVVRSTSTTSAVVPAEPVPTTIGASVKADSTKADEVKPFLGSDASPDPEPSRKAASSDSLGSAAGQRVTWEFAVSHGFTAFHADCQAYLEDKYQEYKASGGRSRYNVRTQGNTISIDFERMSSKSGSSKPRDIRRQERSAGRE